jgi:hypothetical protein
MTGVAVRIWALERREKVQIRHRRRSEIRSLGELISLGGGGVGWIWGCFFGVVFLYAIFTTGEFYGI